MAEGYFVTGTDTEVGKTFVTRLLLRHYREQGRKVLGMKPVAAGCRHTPEGLRNDDALQLMAESSFAPPYEQLNPYAFEAAVAPHIAAARVGARIETARIVEQYRQLAAQAELMIVEGVGGWRVPLNDDEEVADLAHALGLPVILVVGMRLGCINHTLLTAEAIQARGCELHGWIANFVDPQMGEQAENLRTLQLRLGSPLATVAHGETVLKFL